MNKPIEHVNTGPSRSVWIGIIVLAVFAYGWTVYDFFRILAARGHLGLGLLVLGAAVLLLWEQRAEMIEAERGSSPAGWLFLAVAAATYLVGMRAAFFIPRSMTAAFIRLVSLLCFVLGSGLLMFGAKTVRPMWLPAFLMLFALPQDVLVSSWFPMKLQTLAAALGQKLSLLLGMEVVREGHLLKTHSFTANVEEACSGIKALTAIIPAALYLAESRLKSLGPRIALVLLAIPIAVIANAVRITITLLLATHVDPKLAEGFFHSFAGFGVFGIALVALMGVVAVLRNAEGDEQDFSDDGSPLGTAPQALPGLLSVEKRRPQTALLLYVLLSFFLLFVISQVHVLRKSDAEAARYPEKPLGSLSLILGKWLGEERELLENVLTLRTPSDAIFREYQSRGRPPVAFHVLYWAPSAGGMQTMDHSFDVCAPYQGMRQKWKETTEIPVPDADTNVLKARFEGYSSLEGEVVMTNFEIAGRSTWDKADGPTGIVDKVRRGWRLLMAGPGKREPTFAFQLATPAAYGKEAILEAHRELAALLAEEALTAVYGDKSEVSDQRSEIRGQLARP